MHQSTFVNASAEKNTPIPHTPPVAPSERSREKRRIITNLTPVRNSQIIKVADYYKNNHFNPLDYFASAASLASGPTARAYRKAIASISNFLREEGLRYSHLTEHDLRNWLAISLARERSLLTVSYYLDTIAALHNKAVRAGYLPASPHFKSVKRLLKSIKTGRSAEPLHPDLKTVASLFTRPLTGDARIMTDIMLMRTLMGCASTECAAMLKIGDLSPQHPAALLAERNADPRRQYIFPLSQSRTTPSRIRAFVEEATADTLDLLRLPRHIYTPLRIWTEAALSIGISPAHILACLKEADPEVVIPSDLTTLRIAPTVLLSPEKIENIRRRVAAAIVDNPYRWYAMHLRRGVTHADLQTRLSACQDARERIAATYYPVEEISKRIGKKIVSADRPIITSILFFRSRMTDVAGIFREIGDLAWCYRFDGDYAIIPETEMQRFQHTIGQFTPDLHPLESTTISPIESGTKVEITAGPHAGHEAEILKHRLSDDGHTYIYTLRLLGLEFLRWEEEIPAHRLRNAQ